MVGNTTSGCFSYHLNKSLAMAYLHPLVAVPGCEVEVRGLMFVQFVLLIYSPLSSLRFFFYQAEYLSLPSTHPLSTTFLR